MSILDSTALAPALKQIYTVFKIEDLVFKDNPFFAMVAKNEQFYGDTIRIPLVYGNPQGRSASFSTAGTNKTASKLKGFLLSRVADYARASVDNQMIMASSSDAGAFIKAHVLEIDGAMNNLGRSIAIALYRDGSGMIGQIVSTQSGSSTTLTLANADDITNIEVGQVLVSSANSDGTSVGGTGYYVISVDRSAGTFKASATEGGSAATATVTGFTASTYLYVQGDATAKLKGLSAWVPATAPSNGESFFGVDRSADRVRLAGQYLDYSSRPIEEALTDAATAVARQGGSPDHIFLNHTDFANLVKALGAKVQIIEVKAGSDAAFGFTGVAINGPKGVLKVIPDFNCPSGTAWVLTLSTWKLCSLGKAPSLFRGDGLEMIRDTSSDAVNFQCFFYGNLACDGPAYNAQVKLR